jgi:hypothetical protein
MNTETDTLVAVIHDRMQKMTDFERLDIIETLMRGFCKDCGCVDPSGTCQCWNDE